MDIRLFLDKVKLAFQKRTGATQTKKDYNWWKDKGYDNDPEVSFILQSHNKSLQIVHIVRKLREYNGKKEIIVIDDGSSYEHTERLVKELTVPMSLLSAATTFSRLLPMTRLRASQTENILP